MSSDKGITTRCWVQQKHVANETNASGRKEVNSTAGNHTHVCVCVLKGPGSSVAVQQTGYITSRPTQILTQQLPTAQPLHDHLKYHNTWVG